MEPGEEPHPGSATHCLRGPHRLPDLSGPICKLGMKQGPTPTNRWRSKVSKDMEAWTPGAQREAAKAGCKSCGGPCRP